MIGTHRARHTPARRLCAALAVLVLLFAATVASITHSIAMPAMTMVMTPATDHDSAMHDHDCDKTAATDAAASDDDPAPSSAPCDNGCLLCKSCSLVGAVMPAPPVLAAVAPYHDYGVMTALVPAAIAPNPPNEPPRL